MALQVPDARLPPPRAALTTCRKVLGNSVGNFLGPSLELVGEQCWGVLLLIILYFVFKGSYVYNAGGITFWLLVACGVPMFLYSCTYIFYFIYTKNIIEADTQE